MSSSKTANLAPPGDGNDSSVLWSLEFRRTAGSPKIIEAQYPASLHIYMTDLFPVEDFDGWAESYDKNVLDEDHFPFVGYQAALDKVFLLANAQPGMSVLDLGTGTGNLAIPFAEIENIVIKKDESGTLKALECNPRIQGTTIMSSLCGANLIAACVNNLIGYKKSEFIIDWNMDYIRLSSGIGIGVNSKIVNINALVKHAC